MRTKKTIAMWAVLTMANISFSAPILLNGSFETTQTAVKTEENGVVDGWDYSPDSYQTGLMPANEATFAPGVNAAAGTQFAYLWCGANDEIAQTINGFEVGKTYKISWAELARANNPGNLEILMDGVTLDASHTVSTAWQGKSVLFTATATSHRLTFCHSGEWDRMTFIDKISIVEEVVLLDLITNGSFETTQTAVMKSEDGVVDGWDYSPDSYQTGLMPANEATFASGVNASDGNQFAYLWCGANDEIAQTISGFEVDETYTISWSERARATAPGNLWVLMDDVTLEASHVVESSFWTKKSVLFTATATSHRLRFCHGGAWDKVTFIDNISVIEGIVLPNLISNGSFEQTFNTYTGAEDSWSYCSTNYGAAAPSWSADLDWGYVWNPDATGINHWDDYVGLTDVSDGVAAYGAWGTGGHQFITHQSVGSALEGDTLTLTFDSNTLSADYGSQAWFRGKIQFVGGSDIPISYVNTPQDVWTEQSLEVVVSASDAGKEIQVHLSGAGVWVDNVKLTRSIFLTDMAWSPTPENGQQILAVHAASTTFDWTAGAGAANHDVYFGTHSNDVANATAADVSGIYQGRQAGISLDPGTLDTATTYYWRVDEIDASDGVVTGEVWSFEIGTEPRDLFANTWVATDAIDRTLPNITACGPTRTDRVPGIFYFTWHGEHEMHGPHNVTEILAANPSNPAWVDGHGLNYWWAKPEAGYFLAEDEWVIRRNISMLTDAGIKILYLDATNSWDYRSAYLKICEVLQRMKFEGYDTPLQIVFFTRFGSPVTITRIYDQFYSQGLYEDLWYMKDGKPLVLGTPDGLPDDNPRVSVSDEIRNFFTWRDCWYDTHGNNVWSWQSEYPQGFGYDGTSDRVEEMAVTPTGHQGPMGREGRSFSSTSGQPGHDQYHLSGTEGDGLHFAEQIGRALQLDPEFCMFTGWNEWVSGRWQRKAGDGLDAVMHLGQPTQVGDYFFVDQYNQEYSRDIAPMEGGHTDNYYFQMVDGIRRYTGVEMPPSAGGAKSIAIDGSFADWDSVTPEFRDTLGDTFHRNHDGWASAGPYINNTGRNDFLDMKVARDETYVYFYAKTRETLTDYTDPNWMMLFINSDQNNATGWEGYDILVNRSPSSATQTSLEQTSNGWNWTTVSSGIQYIAAGNEIEIRVPRSLIGQGSGDAPVALDFHWADNIQADDDIIQFSVSGDSAPNRRFDYRYQTDQMIATTLLSNDFETHEPIPDWDISTAAAYSGTHSLEASEDDNTGLLVNVSSEGQDSFRVSFKYKLQSVYSSDAIKLYYHDGTDYVFIDEIGTAQNNVWLQYTDVRYNSGDDARFFNGSFGFHIQAAGLGDSSEFVWIDDLEIIGYSSSEPLTPSPLEKYAAWATTFGLDTNNTGAMTFDVEPDGMNNLAEYALGGNPTNNDAASILPTFGIMDAGGGSNVIDYIYNRRLDATLRGLTYGLNESTNLLSEWNYVSNAYETASGEIDSDFESVTNTIPLSTEEGFINLEIRESF